MVRVAERGRVPKCRQCISSTMHISARKWQDCIGKQGYQLQDSPYSGDSTRKLYSNAFPIFLLCDFHLSLSRIGKQVS